MKCIVKLVFLCNIVSCSVHVLYLSSVTLAICMEARVMVLSLSFPYENKLDLNTERGCPEYFLTLRLRCVK